MGAIERGLTTNQGTNVLALILGIFEFGKTKVPDNHAEFFTYFMAFLAIVTMWLTRGHEAIDHARPDAPDEDAENIDLQESLSEALAKGRQFAGIPLGLVSVKMPVGISEKGIDLIKSFEGFRSKAYRDAVGVLTIGWGHTAGVKPGMVITQAQGEAMLRHDLEVFEKGVSAALGKTQTTQGQWDAMVSFSFNVGLGNFRKSSVLRLHKAGNHTGAANALLLWTKAGGRVLPGLTRRRQAERALYLS